MRESNHSEADQRMVRLINQSFKPNLSLSDNFEDRVMSSIHQQTRKSRQGRIVLVTMMLYWSFASLVGSWLWFGKLSAGLAQDNIGLILPLLLVFVTGGLYVLVRQSGLRLSDLFLGTMH